MVGAVARAPRKVNYRHSTVHRPNQKLTQSKPRHPGRRWSLRPRQEPIGLAEPMNAPQEALQATE